MAIAFVGKTGQHLTTNSSPHSSNQLKRTRISPHKDKKDIFDMISPYKEKRTKIGRPAVLLLPVVQTSLNRSTHAFQNTSKRNSIVGPPMPAPPVNDWVRQDLPGQHERHTAHPRLLRWLRPTQGWIPCHWRATLQIRYREVAQICIKLKSG